MHEVRTNSLYDAYVYVKWCEYDMSIYVFEIMWWWNFPMLNCVFEIFVMYVIVHAWFVCICPLMMFMMIWWYECYDDDIWCLVLYYMYYVWNVCDCNAMSRNIRCRVFFQWSFDLIYIFLKYVITVIQQ